MFIILYYFNKYNFILEQNFLSKEISIKIKFNYIHTLHSLLLT